MMILGVDPGLSGGLALINRHGVLQWAEAMPVNRAALATIDVRQLAHMIGMASGGEIFGYVERAQAFPGQGVASSFNYGVLFGSLLTALTDLGVGYELVSPAAWKRQAGLSSDKREAVAMVRQMYPSFPVKRSEDGIAEAILIARYGLHVIGGRLN